MNSQSKSTDSQPSTSVALRFDVIAGLFASWLLGLDAQGVATVGLIPEGLPSFWTRAYVVQYWYCYRALSSTAFIMMVAIPQRF